MPDSSPPPIFGDRYQLVRHIARGGMAQVYLARDLMLDRLVALKVLFPELSVDHNFVERFRREARAAANLTHPNIVSIYDWGQGNRTYYIVMEYVDGDTLSSRIRRGPLDAREAAGIGASVAAALAFAHRHSVIHRDVKPGNVLIDKTGQVKVTDFGIARAVGTSEDLTQAGSVMGTATYFSPEQAQGHVVDARSDVYSLGVVLYEMVVGRAPFHGDNPVAIAYKHVREQPEAPTARNPRVPVDYEAIVLKAMAKSPADRYQSADELRADLERFAAGQPVLARASDATTVVSGAAAAGYAAAYAAASEATTVTPRVDPTRVVPPGRGAVPPSRPAPPAPASSSGGSKAARRISLVVVILAILAVAGFFIGRHYGAFGGSSTLTVPSVKGETYQAATAKLTSQGFTDLSKRTVTDASVRAGNVIGTDPAAGSQISSSHALVIEVSGGPVTVSIPKVAGDTPAKAAAMLKAAGFAVKSTTQNSSTVPAGTVLGTSPAANSKAPKGSTVTILVSAGKKKVLVPTVTPGETPASATQALANAGFTVSQVNQSSDTVASGGVIGTNPAGGQLEPQGSTVQLLVSTGPSTVTVPDIVNDRQSYAAGVLSRHHLTPDWVYQTTTNKAQNGRVISTNPAAYVTVDKGTTITVTIGQYSAPTTTSTSSTTTSTTSTSTTTTTVPSGNAADPKENG